MAVLRSIDFEFSKLNIILRCFNSYGLDMGHAFPVWDLRKQFNWKLIIRISNLDKFIVEFVQKVLTSVIVATLTVHFYVVFIE